MFAYLKGKVTKIPKLADTGIVEIWVEVGGVGYKVCVAGSMLGELAEGKERVFYLSQSSAMYGGETTLYGFLTPQELELFNLLRELPGLGAKKSLEHFDRIKTKSPQRFLEGISRGDPKILTGFFGFSPKTADKIVTQLKDKAQVLLSQWRTAWAQDPFAALGKKTTEAQTDHWIEGRVWEQAKSALVGLGFDSRDAESALHEALGKSEDSKKSLEEIIRLALKELTVAK